eukprot:TRINITY_DN7067_c0_g1_i1.p3 TRINITY_DN7067_c0_g1~~TRINITY_DN7067_c0_g1_i1.p3  ORF type:complete len:147 (-),score=6.64 TRINITY_DN7067_c0_g1_i1:714-1154(-)
MSQLGGFRPEQSRHSAEEQLLSWLHRALGPPSGGDPAHAHESHITASQSAQLLNRSETSRTAQPAHSPPLHTQQNLPLGSESAAPQNEHGSVLEDSSSLPLAESAMWTCDIPSSRFDDVAKVWYFSKPVLNDFHIHTFDHIRRTAP